MGRQRQYATPAARQAAYRQRMKETTIWVDRAPFQRMEEGIATLYQQLHRAAARDHTLARHLVRGTPLDTLDAVVHWVTTDLLPAEPRKEEQTKRKSRQKKESRG